MRIGAIVPAGPGDLDFHRGARRASRRYALHADVEVLEPRALRGVAINVSAGGLRIAVDGALEPGDHCVVRILGAEGRGTVEHARVVWSRTEPDGCVVGLEFVLPH